jgi:hypothetical protein
MNTKLLMTLSAIVMGATGLLLTFLPEEILLFSDLQTNKIAELLLQLLGALYFAFAMINWTARANLIGGIYARPIAIGNLTHFMMGALLLTKGYFRFENEILIFPTIVYSVFAIWFGLVFFTHPQQAETR